MRDGHTGLAGSEALVPRHARLVDAAEGGVGIVVVDDVLALLEREAVDAEARFDLGKRAHAGHRRSALQAAT